jgi:hypothetical protein
MTSSDEWKTQQTQSEDERPDNDELNFDKPQFTFVPKGNHVYRQEGPYIVCYSCELTHALFIGIENIMVGIDKTGAPIIKKRSETG